MTSLCRRDCEPVVVTSGANVMKAPARGLDHQDEFHEGLVDLFVLVHYANHVSMRLWDGEVRNKDFT